MDSEGIYRIHGHIDKSNLLNESKRPILLDRKHKLTEMIVVDVHSRIMQNRVCETLAEVRAEFWIINGKSFVKSVLNKCVICKKIHVRPYNYPQEPVLPDKRVKEDFAFSVTGVDHFGPVYCKNEFKCCDEIKQKKYFVTLYTCASSRATLLDLVSDVSANEFINSLKRFIARRDCPKEIISDNGGAFVSKVVQKYVSKLNMKWKFLLAKAHGMGECGNL